MDPRDALHHTHRVVHKRGRHSVVLATFDRWRRTEHRPRCVQHDVRDAARRAGPSATDVACFYRTSCSEVHSSFRWSAAFSTHRVCNVAATHLNIRTTCVHLITSRLFSVSQEVDSVPGLIARRRRLFINSLRVSNPRQSACCVYYANFLSAITPCYVSMHKNEHTEHNIENAQLRIWKLWYFTFAIVFDLVDFEAN